MFKMRYLIGFFALVPAAACLGAVTPSFDPATGTVIDKRWPSGVPLGGIGVGKIELMTDGSFGNFTNQHNWDRPFRWAKGAFAVIRTQSGADTPVTRMLRLKGADEYTGVENVAHTRMQGWFPRAEVQFQDPALPVEIRLNAFSPLIPHNIKDSSLPAASLDYVITNRSSRPVQASLVLAWPNLLGWGGYGGTSWNDVSGGSQQVAKSGSLVGLRYTSSQSASDQRQNTLGEYFVGVRKEGGLTTAASSAWDVSESTPSFWSAFASSGTLPAGISGASQSAGAVEATVTLAPGKSRTLHFYVVWAMPNMLMVNQARVFNGQYDEKPAQIPQNATSDATRWSTDRSMHAGDHLVIDLGKSYTAAALLLNSGRAHSDYPRGLKVELSDDASAWTMVAQKTKEEMFEAGPEIALTPHTGRYLRLTNLGDDGLFWSIYGLAVRVNEQREPVTPVHATSYLAHSEFKVTSDQAGHFWQNWWKDSLEIASYVDQNTTRLLKETRSWQDPVFSSSVPFWLKLKLINCAFPMYSNTVLTKDGRFSVLESPIDMGGALGTMDQRMAAHAYLTAFFPELDRVELEQFAACQQADGRITHFDGNVHQVLVDPNVNYGITDWPDLSCGWVSQVVKHYRWTGNRSFLDRVNPHIGKAMEWLQKDGQDDELIPAGGSTYDYETLPRGEFIYSASCYLAALRAAAATASTEDAERYNTQLANVQKSIMRDLWTGTYFRKWKQPSTGRTVDDSFIANLAGEWFTRITGLPSTLDAKIVRQSVEQTIARHQKPFFPIPPMQVTPEGKSTTSSCYSLQHEPYLGCEAIYSNYVDDGLETLRRIYFSVWDENNSPWDESLCYDAPNGRKGGLITYMTCPTSWFVLYALGGASIDVPAGRLFISPRLSTHQTELHIPLYFPQFWAWLDYVPAKQLLTLKITRVFAPDSKLQKSLYHLAGAAGDAMPETMTIRSLAADGNTRPITLATPFVVKEGAVLNLSSLIAQLAIPQSSDVVNFQVKAVIHRPGLPSENWKLMDNLHENPEVAAIMGQDALDGNPDTRWTTGRSLQAGDAFTLDMAAVQTVSRLVLDSSKSPDDYPNGYRLEGSADGQTWTPIVHATEAEAHAAVHGGVLTITFAPVQVRYLRLTSEGSHGLWWSVGEIYAYGP